MTKDRYRMRHLGIAWLNLLLVVPSIYLWLGLPLVLREAGWSGTDIGLFQLAGLPVVLKGVMAIPVDKGRWFPCHYRVWSVALISLLVLCLVTLAVNASLIEQPRRLFALALVAGLLASWADVSINALALRCLPADELMRAGALRSSAMFLGAVLGGGLLLVARSHWGWAAPFWIMIAALTSGVALLALCRFRGVDPALRSRHDASVLSGSWLRGFYAQPGAVFWTLLLLTLFPCIGAAWFYLKPLLLDFGVPALQVAWWVGVGGGVIGALASVLGAGIARRLGAFETLWYAAWIALGSLLLMAILTALSPSGLWLLPGVVAIAFAMGLVSAVALGAMMHYARARTYALDYGYQASVFALGRLAVFALAGVLLDHLGYAALMLLLALGMLVVCVLIRSGRPGIEPVLYPKPQQH